MRWEVKDENLNLKSLVLEYQVEGAGVWRRVPIPRAKLMLIGAQQWDAGTADALKVRASVADKAGNVAEATIELPEGTASSRDLATNDAAYDGPPESLQISDGTESDITAGQGFTPVNSSPALSRKRSSGSGRAGRLTRPASTATQTRGGESVPADWEHDPGVPAVAQSSSSGCRDPTGGFVLGGQRWADRRSDVRSRQLGPGRSARFQPVAGA